MRKTEISLIAGIILAYLREIAAYVRKDRTGENGVLGFFLYLSDCLGVMTDWIFDREAEALIERKVEQ